MLSKHHPAAAVAQELQSTLRENATTADENATFPVDSVKALRNSGLFGLLVPEECGGLGADLFTYGEVARILAAGCLSTAMIWAMHSQQVEALVRYGPPELAEAVLPRIAAGQVYLASVTTEPTGAGMMAAATALRTEAGTVTIDRAAPIVTGGEYADGFLITMRDSEGAAANRVTLVYADREQLNLEVSRSSWNPLGMRGTHSVGMHISGTVPARQIVGERGSFRTIATESMIPIAHIGWASCWLGAAKSAYGEIIALLRSRKRPASLSMDSDLVSERLARIRIDLELVSAYISKVTEEVTAAREAGSSLDEPSIQIHLNALKVSSSELTFRAVDRLVQLMGLTIGYSKNSSIPLERHFRDLRSAGLNLSNDRLLTSIGTMVLMDKGVKLI